ncbi:MAG: radical SAM protein [Candidatus Omnitrophota bacterium]|nr:MAG: radical SAM protein [Candidatus Omnitrophota bacterium]
MNLITPFDPWKGKLCTCPKKYNLSAYTGCSHGCLYCYASSYIKNFFNPRPKKDYIKKLEREIKKIPKNSFITMANSSDPYLDLEKDLQLTRKTLTVLKKFRQRVMIVTKSSLVLRDLDILKKFGKIVVSISLTTLKENLAKKLEPFASSPKERLQAIQRLSKYIPVVVRFDPLIYLLNTTETRKLIEEVKSRGAKQIITSTYKVRPDNFQRILRQFPQYRNLWEKLYMEDGERIGGYIYLSMELRKKLIKEVRNISKSFKLEFSSCREGFHKLNTKKCDGSSFF